MKMRGILGTSGWILAVLLAVAVLWQWRTMERLRGELARLEAESSVEPAAKAAPAAAVDDVEKMESAAPETRRRAMAAGGGSADASACLGNPSVRGEIERRAAELATGLAESRIGEYRREETARRLQRRARFMDDFEEASAAGIDAFAKEKAFDEERTAQIHRIFDENIKRQREIFNRLQAGEIDEAAARQEGQTLREEARRQVESLLGEDGAMQLMRAIGDQMRTRFERDRPGPPAP